MFPHHNKAGRLATNLQEFLNETRNGKILHQYISEKYGWEEPVISDINWKALGITMKSYTPYKRNKAAQLLYDWQNDGTQKIKLHDDEGKCPMCTCQETPLHYLYCLSISRKQATQTALQNLSKTLKKHDTYPGIIKVLQTLLQSDDTDEQLLQESTCPV